MPAASSRQLGQRDGCGRQRTRRECAGPLRGGRSACAARAGVEPGGRRAGRVPSRWQRGPGAAAVAPALQNRGAVICPWAPRSQASHRGSARPALAQALSLASSYIRPRWRREAAGLPSPPHGPSSTPSRASGAQVDSHGASFTRPGRATAHAAVSQGQRLCGRSPPLGDLSLAPVRCPSRFC